MHPKSTAGPAPVSDRGPPPSIVESCDALWVDARLATLAPEAAEPYGVIDDGAIAVGEGRIRWVGPRSALAGRRPRRGSLHSAAGRWVTPGLVDCHTHLVHAGSRAAEFEQRLTGVSYEEIARRGGGILATVTATREASEDDLVCASTPRLASLLAEGVTTVEIKSGYGLDRDTEIRQLRSARRLGAELGVGVSTSFLGAHALPSEFRGRADEYIDFVCNQALPAAAEQGVVDAVDAFCEGIGFSPEQTERVFRAARALGLPVKLHAEQLSDLGGAALAARYGALSADHLEYASERSIEAMADAGTVAVLLPGAYYFLRETRLPPIDLFRRHGVAMAIATDCNPGSAPVTSLLLMINMACTLFRMTPEEALAGVTRHAAAALGLGAEIGVLAPGRRADFVLWDIDRPADLAYRIGFNPCAGVVRGGELVASGHA